MKRYFRTLRKNWKTNLISFMGLSVAMMITILSVTYIVFENSYDHFHEKADRIYKVQTQLNFGGQVMWIGSIDDGLKDYLDERVPAIASVCRIEDQEASLIYKETTIYKQRGLYVDPTFMTMFDWDVITGKKEVLTEPGNVLITPAVASKLFGMENPVGESLEYEGKVYTVRGIVKEAPENSEFSFDLLLPLYDKIGEGSKAGSYNVEVYIATVTSLDNTDNLKEDIDGYFKEVELDNSESQLISLKNLHKHYSSSNRDTLLLICISCLVLLVAGVNYFNIFTAQAELRLREMGVRKVSGASRMSIIRIMILEAVATLLVALIVGFILSELVLPLFRDLVNKPLVIYGPGLKSIPLIGFLLAVLTGILTGLFPAVRYSQSRMTLLLHSRERQGKGRFTIRKSLMVLQFTISIGLIITLLMLHSQLRFLSKEDLGFEMENRILIDVTGIPEINYNVVESALRGIPGIVSVTGNAGDIGGGGTNGSIRLKEQKDEEKIRASGFVVQEGFLDTYGIKMVKGRNFKENSGSDSATIIIDTYTANLLGLEEPIGKYINFAGEDCRVIGVTNELLMFPLKDRRNPMFFSTKWKDLVFELTLQISGDEAKIMPLVKEKMLELYPDYFLEYKSLEEAVAGFYTSDRNFFRIILFGGFLALLISLVGAYSMATYLAERKNKEICIRKILGASVQTILRTSGMDLVKLVLLANIIAVPIALYASKKWMENFILKADITLFPFLWSFLLVLVLAWGTMYYKNRQAALSNPADVLRHE